MKQCMGCMEIFQDNLDKCPYCGYEVETRPENTLHMEPGSILNNRYVVGKVIGYGGFGVTYIAWDSLLEQKVAIKEFLPSEFATRMYRSLRITIFSGDKEKQFMEGLVKFVEEAKRIAKFNNVPGIVKIFDCIEENNTAYIIMEYLEGETLATRLEREKKMSADEAISLLLPVMESLKKVNEKGIIHRDIAPDNIFITKNNEPKLIDFGAARYATTGLSRSLTIIIKPGYSPEEQYRSMADQGSWTDVYSIGATLYRMITGETPCDSMERRASIEQSGKDILEPLSKYTNRITANQENAILNAMSSKIEDRTQDMESLIKELTSVTNIVRVEDRRKNKKRVGFALNIPTWVKVAIVAIVLSLVGVFSILGINRNKKDTVLKAGMTRVPNLINLSTDEAISELKKSKLSYKIVGYTYSVSIPEDSVIYQKNEAGDIIEEDSKIEIKVSKIKKIREMSYVIAMNEENATDLLENDGYSIENTNEVFCSNIAKGCIVTQEADTTIDKKNVNITVSKGAEKEFKNYSTKVPKFEGCQFSEALELASEAEVMLEVTKRIADSEHPEGEVLKQSIREKRTVSTGKVIQIEVSNGTDEVTVPDITKLDIDEARQRLEEQGLVINDEYELNENYEKGLVFEQNPEASTVLKTGDTVNVKVSLGEDEEFDMVGLYGMTKEDAIQKLKENGLKAEVKESYSTAVKENCVFSQSVAKGNKVKVGDTITITVRNSGASVSIPDISNDTIYAAEEKLKELGLICEKIGEFTDTISKDMVMGVTPNAGTEVKVGDTVKVTYSRGIGDIESVENVVGNNEAYAEDTLTAQGLEVKKKYVFSDETIGTVTAQSITGGERASTGDVITITISMGKKPTITIRSNNISLKLGESTTVGIDCYPRGSRIKCEVDNSKVEVESPQYFDDMDKTICNVRIIGIAKGRAEITFSMSLINGKNITSKCIVNVE